ncbi:MAG: hypothetical protein ACXWOH_11500, partial [Bdellovibrionota bacterium]
PLAKPAVGQIVVDPQFGTNIRRITNASAFSAQGVKPVYSTMPAWNADESLLLLYRFGSNYSDHLLYQGKAPYGFIKQLNVDPSDIEQLFWSTTDRDILYYPQAASTQFIRYHVSTDTKDVLADFSKVSVNGKLVCLPGDTVTNGTDPLFTSWDSKRIGLACGQWSLDWSTYTGRMFTYDISTNTVLAMVPLATPGSPAPGQLSASGNLLYVEAGHGLVYDAFYGSMRSLGLVAPENHGSMGMLANGHDTWNTTVYDYMSSDSEVGMLVSWDLNTGIGRTIIGPSISVGGISWPYPADAHVSAIAYKNPGWAEVSTQTDNLTPTSWKLQDQELILANTNTGKVCRIGRHRSLGKAGSVGYFAEGHGNLSPSGTRVIFGSDWEGGTTVDSYVIELPSYVP